MVKIFRASNNEPVKRAGYSAQYIADVTFGQNINNAGVILVRVPAGRRTKAHAHRRLEEMFIAMNPTRMGFGSQIVELETGDVAVAEPGEMHWFEAPLSNDVTVIAIKFPNLNDDKIE